MQNPKDENEIGKHILMQYILCWWRCDNKKLYEWCGYEVKLFL